MAYGDGSDVIVDYASFDGAYTEGSNLASRFVQVGSPQTRILGQPFEREFVRGLIVDTRIVSEWSGSVTTRTLLESSPQAVPLGRANSTEVARPVTTSFQVNQPRTIVLGRPLEVERGFAVAAMKDAFIFLGRGLETERAPRVGIKKNIVTENDLPPDTIIEAIHDSVTSVVRRVDIYESDRVTPWALGVHIIDGSVEIDQSRDERRTGNLVLCNNCLSAPDGPEGFWYDKVIKVYRGAKTDFETWDVQIAEFRVDNFQTSHHPNVTSITCRDHTKTLVNAKFATDTTYPENHPIEEVVRDIAFAGGIPFDQMDLALTGESLGRDYTFDREATRWSAIKDVSNSYGYEVYFTRHGQLTMREFQDPFLLVPAYTFRTHQGSNLVSYSKEATDALLRNHVVAVNESSDQVPVWAEAKITDPNSRVNVDLIGHRTDFQNLSFIETEAQAQEVANRFLKVAALEQYSISLEGLVVPYLDVGLVVEFIDPDPNIIDPPTRYLMQKLSIPMKLGTMSGTCGRVVNVEPS